MDKPAPAAVFIGAEPCLVALLLATVVLLPLPRLLLEFSDWSTCMLPCKSGFTEGILTLGLLGEGSSSDSDDDDEDELSSSEWEDDAEGEGFGVGRGPVFGVGCGSDEGLEGPGGSCKCA